MARFPKRNDVRDNVSSGVEASPFRYRLRRAQAHRFRLVCWIQRSSGAHVTIRCLLSGCCVPRDDSPSSSSPQLDPATVGRG